MLLPTSDIGHMCSDVIPIKTWKKAVDKVVKCKAPPPPWYKPWSKPKETCNMSTLNAYKPDVVTPRHPTSLEISLKEQAEAAKKAEESKESE